MAKIRVPKTRAEKRFRRHLRVRNGLGMAIISTSKGLMSDREARQAHVGGELLAVIY